MSNIEKGYIPLKDARTPNIRFDLEFPQYVEKDQIGVNLRQLDGLMRIGGIRDLRVIGVSGEDEQAHVTPMIVGFNGHGEAYAGKAKEGTKTPFYDSNTTGLNQTIPEFRAPNVDIILDMQQIHRRISGDEKVKEGIRSPKAWSGHLNKAVKSGVTKEGISNLTTIDSYNLFIYTVTNAGLIGSPLVNTILKQDANTALLGLSFYTLAKAISALVQRTTIGDNRFSIFFGIQPDRAALLYLMSKTGPVVKEIDASKRNTRVLNQ